MIMFLNEKMKKINKQINNAYKECHDLSDIKNNKIIDDLYEQLDEEMKNHSKNILSDIMSQFKFSEEPTQLDLDILYEDLDSKYKANAFKIIFSEDVKSLNFLWCRFDKKNKTFKINSSDKSTVKFEVKK